MLDQGRGGGGGRRVTRLAGLQCLSIGFEIDSGVETVILTKSHVLIRAPLQSSSTGDKSTEV